MDEAKALQRYEALVAAVGRAIDDADPIGLLELGAPTDEYSFEINAVVPKVAEATNAFQVQQILHKEFVRMFDAEIAGSLDAYAKPASKIWETLLRFRAS